MASQDEADSAGASRSPSESAEEPTTLQEFTASLLQAQNTDPLLNAYREKEDLLDTDSDDSDSSEVLIEAVAQEEEVIEDDKTKKFGHTVKGELTLDDLPPVEKLQIEVPRDKLRHVGNVYSFVDRLVVVESLDGHPVLNLDSVLFLEDGRAIGTIFDVIGPVKNPYYVLRFNNPQEIADEHLDKGTRVFYADEANEMTFFVFEAQIRQLMMMKGSDASWEHDVEPPPNEVAYSDDEAERAAKKENRAKRTHNGKCVNERKHSTGEGQRPVDNQRFPEHPTYSNRSNPYWPPSYANMELRLPPGVVTHPLQTRPPRGVTWPGPSLPDYRWTAPPLNPGYAPEFRSLSGFLQPPQHLVPRFPPPFYPPNLTYPARMPYPPYI